MSNNSRWSRYRMGAPPDAASTARPLAIGKALAVGRIPAKVDMRDKCSPIDDQGQLGSCAACAVIGAMEFLSRAVNNGGPGEEYSRLFVYYNGRSMSGEENEDAGLTTPHAIASILGFGVVPEPQWPYDIRKFKQKPPKDLYSTAVNFAGMTYAQVAWGDPVKSALAAGQPVVFRYHGNAELIQTIKADGMMAPWGRNPPAPEGMGHSMMLVGYDDGAQHMIVRNSWGADFGDHGYFYMPYDVLENAANSNEFWMLGLLNDKAFAGASEASTRQAIEHTRAHASEQVQESYAQMRSDLRQEQQTSLDDSKKSIRDRLRQQEDKLGQKRNNNGDNNN
jgi:hypothetical protein